VIALFKPQFEVCRAEVGKGGIVRDPSAVVRAVAAFRTWCSDHAYAVEGEAPSKVAGAGGNREVFLHLRPVRP
jgi:23S rRNA (cytidine1920-2'-O)/16S rRNA (cytidine1409-2'-O)-methyltransferase